MVDPLRGSAFRECHCPGRERWISLCRHGQRTCTDKRREAATMKKAFLGIVVLLLAPSLVLSDAGVLIPRDQAQPNPAILSLEEMEITIRIDDGDSRVFVRQVFANHTTN